MDMEGYGSFLKIIWLYYFMVPQLGRNSIQISGSHSLALFLSLP